MTTDDDTQIWTQERLADIASRLTYKPGYELQLDLNPDVPMMARLKIRATMPDSRRPGGQFFPLTFASAFMCGPHTDQDGLMFYVRKAIHLFETHEADEWLRLDGNLVNDPHQERTRP